MRGKLAAHSMSVVALATILSGCVIRAEPAPRYYEPPPEVGYYEQAPIHHSKAVKIPPGHLPPPGECRIWYPDRPPGHQPPPGDCYSLQYQMPPGTVLVRG
jgi:hypothetical protein